MRAAQIIDGAVVEVIIVGDPAGLTWATVNVAGGEWVNGADAKIGYLYVDGKFVTPMDQQD